MGRVRRTIKIGSRDVSVKLLAVLIASLFLITGVVIALTSIGTINIGYQIILPTEAPTLTPDTISLDLGSLYSGSSGNKDFGKVATLDVPEQCEITVTLENDFDAFQGMNVNVHLYKSGETIWSYEFYIWMSNYGDNSKTKTVDAGTYDVHVKISQYQCEFLLTQKMGTVQIDISYSE
jgi:hypothetical protein